MKVSQYNSIYDFSKQSFTEIDVQRKIARTCAR